MWNIAKIAPGGKFIALNAHMREEDKQKSNELRFRVQSYRKNNLKPKVVEGRKLMKERNKGKRRQICNRQLKESKLQIDSLKNKNIH